MPSPFITCDLVVMKLIKERCKLAKAQSDENQKNEFINRRDLNRHKSNKSCYEETIRSIFPPRKKWCHLGNARKGIDSLSRNALRLKYTYLREKKRCSTERWYKKLCEYADSIVYIAENTEGEIPPPYISVIEKKIMNEQRIIECRPICSFDIKIKIILSLLNKYLTRLFDSYFCDCSYAFRLPQRGNYSLQHLNAVKTVRNYRLSHLNQPLYVAECDMQKFYDTISHKIIKTRFSLLLHKAIKDKKITREDARTVKQWFFRYVNCYNFLDNVYSHNKKDYSHPFWKKIKNPNGYKYKIKWIEKEDYCGDYTAFLKHTRKRKGNVGVPQGGALSGLIANIIMHNVDKTVHKVIGNNDILYCRFCDDMILIGTNSECVNYTFKEYNSAIKKSLLIPHSKKDIDIKYMKDFWNGKTRGPYTWNERGMNVYPWITFVGFDINWKGNLRIRNASYKKQIIKQNKIVNKVLATYERGKAPRYCVGTIIASLTNRLIGMSVGRVSLWTYNNNKNIHSWMSAFSILDENPWSANQLKALDRHRQVVISRAKKKLTQIQCTKKKKKYNSKDNQRERFMFTGCPFSYYGQCFKYKTLSHL